MRIYDVIIVFRQVLDNKLYNRIIRDEINAYQWQREMGERGVVGGVGVNFYKNRLTNYTITILATRSGKGRKEKWREWVE